MSDAEQDKRSRWDRIASLLGARVPDEPSPPATPGPEAEQGTDEPAAAAPAPPPVKPKRARPARRSGDWNALCGQLGIDAPPPEEPVLADEASSGDPSVVDAEEVDADREPALTFFEPDLAQEADEVDAESSVEPVAELESIDEDVDVPESEPDSRARETGVESTGRRRRRRRRRRPVAEDTPADDDQSGTLSDELGGEPVDEMLDDDTIESVEETIVEVTDFALEIESEDAEPDDEVRARPARRRRRRSGRRGPEQEEQREPRRGGPDLDAERQPPDDEELDLHAETDEDDDEEEDEEDEPTGRAGRGESGRAKHKKIPTWEEAISVIVAANMETRRRDGNGKNRSRGSRRRGRGPNDRH